MILIKKKILIADDSKYWVRKISTAQDIKKYHVQYVKTGPECLKKIKSFKPDLLFIKLMLPEIHGIEILSLIKNNPKLAKIGVILITSKQMIQDYHAAIEAKADYFLIRPFQLKKFFQLIELFFIGKLQSKPFFKKVKKAPINKNLKVKLPGSKSYLKFWGTRGSITVSGTEYTRYGGNTCCLEIRQDNQLVIIDAGTGIRGLGFDILNTNIKKIHLFLGHTHWDHIIGFPFFEPLYRSEYEINIWAPKGFGRATKDLFTDLLAYEFFPIRLDEVQAKITFHEIRDRNPIRLANNLKIDFHYTFHPGMTYCFKIYTKDQTIGYVTDNEMLMGYHGPINKLKSNNILLEPHRTLIDFFNECNLLIHEAQYTNDEYKHKVGWGHSSILNASILLKYIKTNDWIVTHHDPQHNDRFLIEKQLIHKKLLKENKIECVLNYAFDGFKISL
jgi:CheY-like chemotaxis protein/phosphoribosyl 1,2-cyclic phosphodiesterase